MKTYCKKADLSSAEYIEPAIWKTFKGKWKRHDYGGLLGAYGGLTLKEVRTHAYSRNYQAFAPAIRNIAIDIVDRIRRQELNLEPVRYEMRVDSTNGKKREIGIEHPLHQVMEHVAVYCMRDLFEAKKEECQYASIIGKGPEKGAKTIAQWVRADNRSMAFCQKHNYSAVRRTAYFVQGDIIKCFPSIRREVVMQRLRRDITKNETLLWLVDDLLKMHLRGLIIGSLLSQFLCNYIMSFAIRKIYNYKKMRRGKSVPLVTYQIWYMDDFLLVSNDRRNIRITLTKLSKFLKQEYGIKLKEAHIKQWNRESPDMMGYIIHSNGTITIRGRTFLRAKRAFTRAKAKSITTIHQARRIVSMKGRFINSNCTKIRKLLHIDEISKSAQAFISNYDKGRLNMACT